MKLTFWGTRGSIPVPGPDTVRYGGNTTCLELELAEGQKVIVDAGSGIRPLGRALCRAAPEGELFLLVTHLHWDHILGFLFFEPAFKPGWRIQVAGWPLALKGLRNIFDSRRSDGHFPVMWDDLPGRVEAAAGLEAPRFRLGQTEVSTVPLNHPQGGVGFRFQEGDTALVFITDNELGADSPRSFQDYVRFCRGAQVLIHDTQYLPQESAGRRGWGHSDWGQALELARRAEVPRLVLFHHDPARTDQEMDLLLAEARRAAGREVVVDAAQEGMVIEL